MYNNGDSPITPLDARHNHQCFGLTKREYLAGLAMQGILASGMLDRDVMCDLAVRSADELLDELG